MRNFWLKAFWLVLLLQASAIGLAQVSCVNYPRDNYIEVNFHLPDYRIIDSLPDSIYEHPYIYNYIVVDNPEFGIIDSVGCPELPQLTINLNIPWNAHDVSFKILDIGSTVVDLDYPYYPHQPDISLDDSVNIHKFFINGDLYDTIGAFPVNAADTGELFILRDRKGITLCIMPFIYDGRYNTIRVIRSMQLRVDYLTDSIVEERVDPNVLWENYYDGIFENYTAQNTGGAGTSGRYLMVVHENLSQAIGSFMAYKRNIGYAVDTITIRSADATPSLIKAKIQQRYDNPATRPDFVLLVGDHNFLPAYCGDPTMAEINYPITDLSYACLSGDDLCPEVWLGRWPVISESDVKSISNKTIFMEMNMHVLGKRAVFISGDNSPDDWIVKRNFMIDMFNKGNDKVREDFFIPEGYVSDALYQPSEQQTRSLIELNPLFFIYSGHGDVQYVGPLKYYTATDAFRMRNSFFDNVEKDVYPMAFVFACKTGNYAANEVSVGEGFIRNTNGVVSYIGSSVISITNSDNVLERKILGESLFGNGNAYLGSVIDKGKAKFRSYIRISKVKRRRYSRAYNLMGDPSMLVFGWGCGHDYWIENTSLCSGDKHVYHASNYANITSCTVGAGARLAVTSGDEIVIENGFEAMYGSDVTLSIEPCINPATTKSAPSTYDTDVFWEHEFIDAMLPEDKIKVYPSPVHDVLTIEYYTEYNAKTWINIYDVYGRVVVSREIENPIIGLNREQIDLRKYPKGSYFVNLTIGTVRHKTACIIKK